VAFPYNKINATDHIRPNNKANVIDGIRLECERTPLLDKVRPWAKMVCNTADCMNVNQNAQVL